MYEEIDTAIAKILMHYAGSNVKEIEKFLANFWYNGEARKAEILAEARRIIEGSDDNYVDGTALYGHHAEI